MHGKHLGKKYMKRDNSVLYGLIAGTGLLLFYITIVSIFQGFEFAIMNFRSLWYWIIPLAAGFGTQERRFWPTPEQLVNDVTTHHPKIILIDDKYNPHPRGIALNLETGEVKEIDNSKVWTWSDQQDTSLNRRIDELEENI